MEVEEIKIDGITYVPTDNFDCEKCAFNGKCVRLVCKERETYKFPCNLVAMRALKVKEG